MCGIAGIYDRFGPADPARAEIVTRMTRSLVHRGPDDEGYYRDAWVALGHRRLSIIDLATGQQPLSNEDRSVWIVFNGEIYNYRDLARDLAARGHRFATESDTEAIVHAYEEWGTGCLDRLRGMFAFAIWDQRQRRLLLACDRLGKKPLYYAALGETLIFGSELKALLAFPGLDRDLDLQALSDYLSLLYVPAPKTIFRNVRKLEPGSYLLAGADGYETRRYWDVQFRPEPCDPAAAIDRLGELLHEAVRIRLRSDVPLGAFLSGGLDSSTVVALMARETGVPVTTLSIGFPEEAFNELAYAGQIARQLATEHHELTVTPAAMDVLQTLAWHYDEPFADSSAVPTYYVAKLARQHVTVALSGDGGDENFAGYRRYVYDGIENSVRRLFPAPIRRGLFGLLGQLYPKADYLPQVLRGKVFLSNVAREPWHAYFSTVSAVPDGDKARLLHGDVGRALGGYRTDLLFEELYRAVPGGDPLTRIQYIDFKTYLPGDILTKVDRASMANSLEVRCPLLDHELVEYAASLPAQLKLNRRTTKFVFKEAARRLLPSDIVDRPKAGFSVPIDTWLRGELRPLVEEYVLGGATRHAFFDPAVVRRLWREHASGVRTRGTELWVLLMFNLWHDRFVRLPAPAHTATDRAAAPVDPCAS